MPNKLDVKQGKKDRPKSSGILDMIIIHDGINVLFWRNNIILNVSVLLFYMHLICIVWGPY